VRVLDTVRLHIRPFTWADESEFTRLLDEAFGADAYGSAEEKRALLHFNIIADVAHALLHQPSYEDRAIVLAKTTELIGAVGFAPVLAPFGLLPSFAKVGGNTSEVGLFWALFPKHENKGYGTEAARAMVDYAFEVMDLARIVATTEHDNARSIRLMRRFGMRIERNPEPEPPWFQTVGVLENTERLIVERNDSESTSPPAEG
jgi:ribosomal-protein-alanine N-acetyltransferase